MTGKMSNKEAIDWIDRLVATMKKETNGKFSDPEYKDEVYEALQAATDALRVQPCSNWIPVEEKLPDEDDHLLVSLSDGTVQSCYYHEDKKMWHDGYYDLTDMVQAWMPSPASYKKGCTVQAWMG